MNYQKKLAIVIPLANEENTIDELLNRILKQIPKNSKIFCVIDNVSKDNTKNKIQKLSLQDSRVILVWAPENRCVVDAYFKGYKEALKINSDWILEMDGGFSHTPEEIPRFLKAMNKGYDFAAGSRFIKDGKYIKPRIRYIISKGGTQITNFLLGTKMKDMTSGFECFSKKAMEYILSKGVKSRAHFFQTEIRYMLHNWNWIEVPITYKNPSKSVGKSNIMEAFRNLWNLYKTKNNKKNLS